MPCASRYQRYLCVGQRFTKATNLQRLFTVGFPTHIKISFINSSFFVRLNFGITSIKHFGMNRLLHRRKSTKETASLNDKLTTGPLTKRAI